MPSGIIAAVRSAPDKLASDRLAPDRFACNRKAPDKFAFRDFQIKKCPKTDAEILSLCTLCLCGSFLRIIYFLEVS